MTVVRELLGAERAWRINRRGMQPYSAVQASRLFSGMIQDASIIPTCEHTARLTDSTTRHESRVSTR